MIQPICRIDKETYEMLSMSVMHIIHCAGSIKFELPLVEAAEANITSALNVLELEKSCLRLQPLVGTSTVYVSPHISEPIIEELVPLHLPAAKIFEGISSERTNESELLELTGHPNTYTVTKCIAEHLIMERRGEMPLTIVRPSIISASLCYPFPGWIDSHAALRGSRRLLFSECCI